MIRDQFPNKAIERLRLHLYNYGQLVKQKHWQSVDSPDDTWEVIKTGLSFPMPEHLNTLQKQVRPNLPWAEDHFKERISGKPLNPGNEYKNWPFYKRKPEDDKFRTEEEKFSHTYMERFWPKSAGVPEPDHMVNHGIRYSFGDLQDVINLLKKDLTTRQAFLPVWFPEDTGCVHGQRVPCSLGYDFIIRNSKLHLDYYIRSCDYLRHLRDDIYMAIRLAMHIRDNIGVGLYLGRFDMHIKNLHVFNNEKELLRLDK